MNKNILLILLGIFNFELYSSSGSGEFYMLGETPIYANKMYTLQDGNSISGEKLIERALVRNIIFKNPDVLINNPNFRPYLAQEELTQLILKLWNDSRYENNRVKMIGDPVMFKIVLDATRTSSITTASSSRAILNESPSGLSISKTPIPVNTTSAEDDFVDYESECQSFMQS